MKLEISPNWKLFTLVLLVMLVTNIMSDRNGNRKKWEEISSIAVIKTASLDGNGKKRDGKKCY